MTRGRVYFASSGLRTVDSEQLGVGPNGRDLPLEFRTADYVREWLPEGGSRCGSRGLRRSRWSGSSGRRIATRLGKWRSATRSSEQTIYTWRKRFGQLPSEDVRRLRQLETEKARLKKLVAERDLEIEVMKRLR
jgi:hypothetical protein